MSKENRLVLILIFLAYIFSYLVHIYWIHWASRYPEFFWNTQLMINNPDGYFYGSGAQKIVYHLHLYNPRLVDVYHYGTAVITAYLAKFLHISIDTLMLYLPPIISSLVVIPIILIGKLYRNLIWGFLASLIASIGWSYYNRTLAGYYDTDMFAILLPIFILYFLLKSIKNNDLNSLVIALIIAIFYPWIYGSGKAILYSIFIIYMIYLLIFNKNSVAYKNIFLASIVLLPFNLFIQLILLISLFLLLKYKTFSQKTLFYLAIFGFIIFLLESNFIFVILHHISSYISPTKKIDNLHFLNVARTVREAGNIPWYIIFDRIIGSSLGLLFAVIGYILLVKKHKEFIIALPFWGIGFFAFLGGLRFTVYAVPIAAISGVYFFFYLAEKYKNNKKIFYGIPIMGSIFLILPNITHIYGCCERSKILASIEKVYPIRSYPYLVPTVLNKKEVYVLNELKKISNPKDYVITWWDYGYPIWYYADVNTLIDGGKHKEDNFIVSKILTTSNPYLASHLSKLAIKIYIDTNKTVATQLFIKNGKPINVNAFLNKVGKRDFSPPKLNRNIYLMFPYRMFNIFPTIVKFSNRNLNTGEVYKNHFFYKGKIIQIKNILYVGNLPIDLQIGMLILKKNLLVPIKTMDIVKYNKLGKLVIMHQKVRDKGLNLIILESYKEGLILDDYYYNSMFVQMFIFENYNKKLFKPIILNPFIKIYKIK